MVVAEQDGDEVDADDDDNNQQSARGRLIEINFFLPQFNSE